MTGYMRRSPLARLLAALTGRWNAGCGCRWDLPGAANSGWVPCDWHIDRLLRAVRRGENPVTAYCPDCETELQDEGFEFWCPHCEAAVSFARVAAEGE